VITYSINPSERLQRRISTVLTNDLLSLPLFTGFTTNNGREFTPTKYPFFSVQVSDCQEVFPRTNVWNVTVSIAMAEDREEANLTFGEDPRPRHELRAENVTARIYGGWNGLTLPEGINAIDDNENITVLKMYNSIQSNGTMSEDEICMEYSFVMSCTTTEQ
jgi:hypothetical protein